jgi:hypothetical protein
MPCRVIDHTITEKTHQLLRRSPYVSTTIQIKKNLSDLNVGRVLLIPHVELHILQIQQTLYDRLVSTESLKIHSKYSCQRVPTIPHLIWLFTTTDYPGQFHKYRPTCRPNWLSYYLNK